LTREDWVVCSNAPEKRVVRFEKSKGFEEDEELLEYEWLLDVFEDLKFIKLYEFEEIGPLSTYLYTINAGPYKIFEY
jgi:ssDNA-binding Zn-finger/Zn-ribbon topoisomerase 1